MASFLIFYQCKDLVSSCILHNSGPLTTIIDCTGHRKGFLPDFGKMETSKFKHSSRLQGLSLPTAAYNFIKPSERTGGSAKSSEDMVRLDYRKYFAKLKMLQFNQSLACFTLTPLEILSRPRYSLQGMTRLWLMGQQGREQPITLHFMRWMCRSTGIAEGHPPNSWLHPLLDAFWSWDGDQFITSAIHHRRDTSNQL